MSPRDNWKRDGFCKLSVLYYSEYYDLVERYFLLAYDDMHNDTHAPAHFDKIRAPRRQHATKR